MEEAEEQIRDTEGKIMGKNEVEIRGKENVASPMLTQGTQ